MKTDEVIYAKVEKKAPAAASASTEQSLFAARKKIFMRTVKGYFNNYRWFFVWLTQLVFYVTPWLQWNGRQAVLYDLATQRYYMFGLVLQPSDIVYMTGLLIISALGLFLFTAIAGRLWCGYTCPQTVYTEIFMWIERKIEGDRNAQIRLDKAPMSASKASKKISKHLAWGLFALWSGYTLVAYFTPLRELLVDTVSFNLTGTEIFWILFYGFMMYLFAGWMREQVCKYMCPYARFQSVMFDPDTLIVTYDAGRGESRGVRKKNVDPRSIGKGDCIDCGVCVDVCPTGIDIRNGLQMECIGCGACIDGCNDIMDKMNYPRGLIRYDTENGVKDKLSRKELLRRVARGRVLIYAGILCALIAVMTYKIGSRSTFTMNIERDARSVARTLENGDVENIYRIQLSNISEAPHAVELSATGLNSVNVDGGGQIKLEPLSSQTIVVKLHANPAKARGTGGTSGNNSIMLHLKPLDTTDDTIDMPTVFTLPSQ